MTSPTPAPTTPETLSRTFITDKQLRERWQCSPMKLWRLRGRGLLRAIKVGGTGLNLTPRSEVKAAEEID